MVGAWLEDLETRGLTPDLRSKCGQLLRRCLDYCVESRYLRTNPARKVALHRTRPEEMRTLDADQVTQFLRHATKHRLAALWFLALDSGMRLGEMLALTWPDIDFAAGTVSVTKSVRTGDKGGPRVKEVKTKASRRRIRLTRRTLDVLADRRTRMRGPLVFSTPGQRRHFGQTRYLNKANLRKCFRNLLRKAELPPVRLHDLRHTHATLALLGTKNVKAVSARLGHSDIRVTLNTYSHYLPIMEDEYVCAMEALLAQPAETQPPAAAVQTAKSAPST
jgi:integrase